MIPRQLHTDPGPRITPHSGIGPCLGLLRLSHAAITRAVLTITPRAGSALVGIALTGAVLIASIILVASLARAAVIGTAHIETAYTGPAVIGEKLAEPTVLVSTDGAIKGTEAAKEANLILHFAESDSIQSQRRLTQSIATRLKQSITWIRPMSGNAAVVSATLPVSRLQHQQKNRDQLIKRLSVQPELAAVTWDAPLIVHAIPDDPRFIDQWQLRTPDRYIASLDAERAWDLTLGSTNTVVAVIDTGVRFDHPDLQGRLLPGYDFVSATQLDQNPGSNNTSINFLRADDGDGRDADASDPGDAVNALLQTQLAEFDIDCNISDSSWHGTAMSSIIAANANDGIGMSGIDHRAQLLPIRAIGKCGGRRSDLLDAIRWAAGVSDPNLPPNPTPAQIINLSLGIEDVCNATDQAAIDAAIAAGSVIVSAVGNAGRNTNEQPTSPSHCQNVIGVMAVDPNGRRATYSNFGQDADIAAPGGDLAPLPTSILVASNSGIDDPSSEHVYRQVSGTSVAAPHVSGVLALMLSVNPDLSTTELTTLLYASVRPFPYTTDDNGCQQDKCGAGLLDAYSAVRAASNHIAGSFIDAPQLQAANAEPVLVGNGVGCAILAARSTDNSVQSQSRDPLLLMLLLIAALNTQISHIVCYCSDLLH